MLKIDDSLLKELGLGDLPLEEKDLLVSQIREQLELRVGSRLAEAMSDEQLNDFETNYIQKNDEEGAMKWLGENFPDYPNVVKEELEKLKEELKNQSSAIKDAIHQERTSGGEQQTPEQG